MTTTPQGHAAHCVELARTAIIENNEATLATEGHYGTTSETDETAIEWLANGNVSCWCEPTADASAYQQGEAEGYESESFALRYDEAQQDAAAIAADRFDTDAERADYIAGFAAGEAAYREASR